MDTDLAEDKYDLITLPHVLYYYRTPEERTKLFKRLVDHLSPGGVIWCLVFSKTDSLGNPNQHFQMYKELKPLVVKAKGGSADSSKGSGGNLVMADSLWEEWNSLADKLDLASTKRTLTVR